MPRQVAIRDIGPIHEFTFEVPEEGVVEFRGPNGAGKTHALDAINSLATGNSARVTMRDGAVAGVVEGFGATLKIGRRASRAGELEVISLEGRFSVLDLVDPKLKDPNAADAKRIKALIQLAHGKGADPSLFYPLVGGPQQFEALVGTKALDTDDVVTMAARIKRDLEEKAREYAEAAEKALIKSVADRDAATAIDLTAPCDEQKLAADLELAIAEEAQLKTRARAALEAQYRVEEAAKAIKAAEATYTGPGIGVAEAQMNNAGAEVVNAQGKVDALERELAKAREALNAAKQQHEKSELAYEAAVRHETTIAKWRETLASHVPEGVSDEQLAAAREDVEAAREAVQLGALVRDAQRRVAEADKHAHRAAELRTEETRLREAARATDDVLSSLVAELQVPLRVSHGRLVTPTDRSETELFSDLSRGEQWRLAIKVAVNAVGRGGLLVVDQEGWEGIDPEHKQIIVEELTGSGVLLITAHCDTGELRASTLTMPEGRAA